MKPIPKKPEEQYYDLETAASTMECTGLIPTAVLDEDEAESYRAIYSIHKQKPID